MTTPDLPAWLSTERDVRDLMSLLGFDVTSVSVAGRQIDLVARRVDRLLGMHDTWAIEITTEHVGVDKGSRDMQKLHLMRESGGATHLMICSTAGFTDDQRATLEKLGILCRTYEQLEATRLNLMQYAVARKSALESSAKTAQNDIGYDPQTFVQTDVNVSRTLAAPGSTEIQTAASWIREVLTSSNGLIGALLGDLGSGKTTLMQHVELQMLKDYVADPSRATLPLYVQLSQFKLHSGRIDSILRELFQQAGVENYPHMLVATLARSGRLAFLFDGLDEVHPLSTTEDVLRTVSQIFDYLGRDMRAVISSRSHLFATSAEELAMFGPYERGSLTRLATQLNAQLASRPSTEMARIRPLTIEQRNEYLRLTCGVDHDQVRSWLDGSYGFAEMARTPVLLAMMRATLPDLIRNPPPDGTFSHLELYRAYTDRWIGRDEHRAQLSANLRKNLSIQLACLLIKRDASTASWAEIRDLIQNARSRTDEDAQVGEAAASLDVRNSTFLVRDSDDSFRFVHRSIMEFFVAQQTLEQLRVNSGGFTQFSDGFMMFLRKMVAEAWAKESGNVPIAVAELTPDSRWGDAQTLSLLADASLELPRVVSWNNCVVRADSLATTRFHRVRFSGGTIDVRRIENLSLDKCEAGKLRVLAREVKRFEITDSLLGPGSSISLPLLAWNAVAVRGPIDDINRAMALGVPAGYVSASVLLERCEDFEALIDGQRWRVPLRTLCMVAEIKQKLRGSKIQIDSWSKGTFGDKLRDRLATLARLGIVSEDTSRLPHQLEPGKKWGAFFTTVQKEPMKVQETLLALQENRPATQGSSTRRAPRRRGAV